MIKINIQYKCKRNKNIPSKKNIKKWIKKLLKNSFKKSIITIRIVKKYEIKKINYKYRKQKIATNILTFSIFKDKKKKLLLIGDLIICKKILQQEAKKYNTEILEYWAHIIIHGILHLIGYKHENLLNQQKMEKLEIKTMLDLGFKNPYFYNK
ncbi:MAG: rRNA maturation RNase YbeY [Buchnera aphidicola (Periphyllus lyropictus)]|uniref:rRNA maturation RNase YbeY n=1 Tax=Buchnera aphidicola TaxID=9 RepID=UPI001EC3BA10|nr:rRNA maturation RNase YbeY [Buchnera aphidicola]NIH16539.1 rRNA maturation RNase YbeY [Buchnera aphidicola (Periphyllus lyropictus)]USS94432.1 rRNA maturation RNase YbeY [Buchnera aphidicola (Periphyllus lyropictus)]